MNTNKFRTPTGTLRLIAAVLAFLVLATGCGASEATNAVSRVIDDVAAESADVLELPSGTGSEDDRDFGSQDGTDNSVDSAAKTDTEQRNDKRSDNGTDRNAAQLWGTADDGSVALDLKIDATLSADENHHVVVTDDGGIDFPAERLVVEGSLDRVSAFFAGRGTVTGSITVGQRVYQIVSVVPTADDETKAAERMLGALDTSHQAELEITGSSTRAFALLGIGAEAAANGLPTSVDYGLSTDDVARAIASSQATEDFSWNGSTNPFDWDYMRDGTVQNIGVTEAWRILNSLDLLREGSATIAVLDQGYTVAGNPDVDGAVIYPADADGRPGTTPCSTGNPCPDHGRKVATVAAGDLDDGADSAGPGGPVADLLLIDSDAIKTDAIDNLRLTKVFGALSLLDKSDVDVLNISASVEIPWTIAWLVDPLAGALADMAENRDIVIVASAGNKGINVDRKLDCGLFRCPWEAAIVAPCEIRHVICVGGLAPNSTDRDSSSNHGSKDVDIWAPFWHAGDGGNAMGGTSYSAPFVAGIISLLRTAKPDIEPAQVRKDLALTANEVDGRRIVNAAELIRRATVNHRQDAAVFDFDVRIEAQPDESGVTLTALVNGQTRSELIVSPIAIDHTGLVGAIDSVTWTINGAYEGRGNEFKVRPRNRQPGLVTVVAELIDLAGNSHTVTTTVELVDSNPVVTVTPESAIVPEGHQVEVQGEIYDWFEMPNYEWRINGVAVAESDSSLHNEVRRHTTLIVAPSALAPGNNVIELMATTARGATTTAVASITVEVPEVETDAAPVVQITDVDTYWYQDRPATKQTISVTATDAEDGDMTDSLIWYVVCLDGSSRLLDPVRVGDSFEVEMPTAGIAGCETYRIGDTHVIGYELHAVAVDSAENVTVSPAAILQTTVVIR